MSKESENVEHEDEMEQFDELERNFHRVITDLVAERAFDRFREEYENLHQALLQSHEKNQSLIDKCKELNNNILANANKISSVLTLSQNDQRTIAGLRHEFEKAWKMVEVSQDREAKTADVIDTLKQEVSNLSRLVDQGGAAAMTQQVSLQDISDSIVQLKKEIKVQESQLKAMVQQVEDTKQISQEMRDKLEDLKEQSVTLAEDYTVFKEQNKEVAMESDEKTKECTELKELIKSNTSEMEQLDKKIKKQKKLNAELESVLFEEKRNMKAADDDIKDTQDQLKTTNKLLQNRQKDSEKTQKSIKKFDEIFTEKDKIGEEFNNQLKQIMIEYDANTRELEQVTQLRRIIEQDRSEARTALAKAHQEVYLLTNEQNAVFLNNQILRNEYERETKAGRDLKQKSMTEHAHTKAVEGQATIVNSEILGMKAGSHQDRGKVTKLDDETNEYVNRTIAANNSLFQIKEETKINERNLDECCIKLSQIQSDMKHQDALTETIQSERDFSHRMLEGAMKDNQVMTADNHVLYNQIKQLKDDIREKDSICVETHLRQKKCQREIKVLKKQVNEIKRKLKEADNIATEHRNKISRAMYYAQQSDLDTMKQKQVVNEIETSSKLMDRTVAKRLSESKILIEKAHVLQSTITTGSNAYRKIVNQINDLKEKAEEEVYKQQQLMNRNRHSEALKIEILRIEHSLLLELGKSRGLEDELEKPINVHRWRFLDSTDPESAQLIRMNQALQDKLMILISRLERYKNEAKMLKEKLNIEEKHLQKSYGGQYEEEKAYLLNILKQKNKLLLQMQDQATYQQTEVYDHKEQVMTVRTMVREEKTELLDAKKMVNKIRAKTSMGRRVHKPEAGKQTTPKSESKYVGGGFAVGSIQTPRSDRVKKPATRQQVLSPALVLPTTPRKAPKTPQKTTPRGWNPSRGPISPYLPTMSDEIL